MFYENVLLIMKKGSLILYLWLILMPPMNWAQEESSSPVRLLHVETRAEWLEEDALLSLTLTARLGGFEEESTLNNIRLRIVLLDENQNEMARGEIPWFERLGDQAIGDIELSIKEPQSWNAEQPYLYTLAMVLEKSGDVLDRQHRPLGLREILVDEGTLLLNRKPITMRGIQFDASRWKNLKEEERKQNEKSLMEWMEYTHVNTVRIMHATPSEHWMQLCDERGVYVLCDVPKLNQTNLLRNSLEPLKQYSSLIAWNIPSEMGSDTEIRDRIDKVKLIDSTRLLCVSGERVDQFSEKSQMLAPACDNLEEWRPYRSFSQPIIAFDLPFDLHWKFEGLGEIWDFIRDDAFSTGMCFTPFEGEEEWLHWDKEEEDLLFSTFSPMLERIYSPIQISEKNFNVKPGKQMLELTLQNDYDFLNLDAFTCRWALLEGNQELQADEIQLFLPPRKEMQMAVEIHLPDEIEDHEYFLRLRFFSREGTMVHEHMVRLLPNQWREHYLMRLRNLRWDEDWKVNASVEEIRIEHRDYSFRIPSATTEWFLFTKEHNVRLITGGPYFRLGREWDEEENETLTWKPEFVSDPELLNRDVERLGKNTEIRIEYGLLHENREHWIHAYVDILNSPYGFCDIRFRYDLEGAPQVRFDEIGLAFLIPKRLDRVMWVGEGPFPTYPGCQQKPIHRIYDYSPVDKLLPGNRSKVQLAAFLDDRGYGLGIMMLDGNLHFDQTEEGTLVSVNSFVAGVGNRGQPSESLLEARDLDREQVTAAFRLVPLIRGHYPIAFESLDEPFY